MKQEDLVSAYSQLLNSLGVVSKEGFLSLSIDNDPVPLTCEDKRMVLPEREILANFSKSTWTAFHPICESTVRGESPVLRKLRTLINARLTFQLLELTNNLLAVAMDNKRQSGLPPDLKEYLTLVPEIREDAHKEFKVISDIISNANEHRAVNIYIKRGANLNEVSYKRGAIVSFPLLDELHRKDNKVFGRTVTLKNKRVFLELLKFVLAETEDRTAAEIYSFGSNSNTAPNFHALVNSYGKLAKRLSSLVWEYRSVIPAYKILHSKTDWVSTFKDLSGMVGLIPVLSGNDGDVDAQQEIVEQEAAAPQQAQEPSRLVARPIAAPTAPAPSVAVAPTAPLALPSTGRMSSADSDAVNSWTASAVNMSTRPAPLQMPQYQQAQQYDPRYNQPQQPTVSYPTVGGGTVNHNQQPQPQYQQPQPQYQQPQPQYQQPQPAYSQQQAYDPRANQYQQPQQQQRRNFGI